MGEPDLSSIVMNVFRSNTERAYAFDELMEELSTSGMKTARDRVQGVLGVLEAWRRIEVEVRDGETYYAFYNTTAFGTPRKRTTEYISAAAKWVKNGIKGSGVDGEETSQPARAAADALSVSKPAAEGESIIGDLESRNFVKTLLEGLLNYPQLLSDGIGLLFSDPDVAARLDEAVERDLSEALRCLAFNICTASTRCSLRAVEGALRRLYAALGGQDAALAWEPLLVEVEGMLREREMASPELIGHLNYAKKVRDSAARLGKAFTKTEAEHTLMNSSRAVEEMHRLVETLE